MRETGNLFLTNIHRVYLGEIREPSVEDDDLRDYFLAPFGPRPVGKTTDSRTDLGEIVREIDELAVFNDEAHHIHDRKWPGSRASRTSTTECCRRTDAWPCKWTRPPHLGTTTARSSCKRSRDYPLVEAIHQNVVKHPVLPDAPSRARLQKHTSAIFTERYADYLQLGIEEWRKSYAEHETLGKKAVLFVMVDDTRNCDEVGAWLEKTCPEFQDAVLVIHTKNNGEISEAASGKNKEELARISHQCVDTWAKGIDEDIREEDRLN